MIIKKIDINSILPIIIKVIKTNLEDVSNFEKEKFCKLNISEFTVFVNVSMDNLNDLSKPISSITRRLDKINKLKKKEIKIKNEILIFSSLILFSELNIVRLITLFGLISLIISDEVIFNKI